MLVHLGTRVEVTFGLVSENGDIANPTTFPYQLHELTEQGFADLQRLITEKRQELAASAGCVDGEVTSEEVTPESAGEPAPDEMAAAAPGEASPE